MRLRKTSTGCVLSGYNIIIEVNQTAAAPKIQINGPCPTNRWEITQIIERKEIVFCLEYGTISPNHLVSEIFEVTFRANST